MSESMPMKFEEFVEAASQCLGSAKPVPDERGICSFYFSDGLSVDVSAGSSGTVCLTSAVAPVPEGSNEAERFCKKLLQLNLGRLRSFRPFLSINPHSGILELGREIPPGLKLRDEVEPILEDFLNELEYWKGQAGGSSVENPPMMMPFLR